MKLFLLALLVCLNTIFRGYSFEDSPTVIIKMSTTTLGLPTILIGGFSVLLDSGSNQFWLADHSCADCPITADICPHIKKSAHSVTYFRGAVFGEYAYLNIEDIYTKLLCIKQLNMLANIEANGILGFRGNSHGNTFLKNYLRKLGVTNDRISFYYGLKETKIILGPITNKYVINKLNIEHTTDWTISCLSISINNKSYPTTHDILFDTGSSVVLFPADIYTLFRQHIVQQLTNHPHCDIQDAETGMIIKCLQQKAKFNFTISFQLIGSAKSIIMLSSEQLIEQHGRQTHILIVQSTLNTIIIGRPIFNSYIIQFDLSSHTIDIYLNNRQSLQLQQQMNFKIIILTYILTVAMITFTIKRSFQLISGRFNRKIII